MSTPSDDTRRLRKLIQQWRERSNAARELSMNPSADALMRAHYGAVAQISTSDADELEAAAVTPQPEKLEDSTRVEPLSAGSDVLDLPRPSTGAE